MPPGRRAAPLEGRWGGAVWCAIVGWSGTPVVCRVPCAACRTPHTARRGWQAWTTNAIAWTAPPRHRGSHGGSHGRQRGSPRIAACRSGWGSPSRRCSRRVGHRRTQRSRPVNHGAVPRVGACVPSVSKGLSCGVRTTWRHAKVPSGGWVWVSGWEVRAHAGPGKHVVSDQQPAVVRPLVCTVQVPLKAVRPRAKRRANGQHRALWSRAPCGEKPRRTLRVRHQGAVSRHWQRSDGRRVPGAAWRRGSYDGLRAATHRRR